MTPLLPTLLDRLADMATLGYAHSGVTASEPAALAALALLGDDRPNDARRAIAWLLRHQNDDGSVGVMADHREPCWPTSLATLAWQTARNAPGYPHAEALDRPILAALDWLLDAKGATLPNTTEFGHDVSLVGWPWVIGTHSWIEPTALAVLALRASDHAEHPRCREAERLLVDRQISTGGCNYGNTIVLGQETLPHTQPTGVALLALAASRTRDPRIEQSLAWLERALDHEQGTPSLAFGLLALVAHERTHGRHAALIAAATARTLRRPASAYHLALLAHAGLGERSPLVRSRPSPPSDPSVEVAMSTTELEVADTTAPVSAETVSAFEGASISRRALFVGGGLAAAGLIGYPLARQWMRPKTPVFIARGQRYDGPLRQTIADGLTSVGIDPATLRGKRVLLKPNLVEPTKVAPHITTHPAVVVAAAEVFRGWGAEVVVGEAPGHVRDSEMALYNSGYRAALDDARIEFADLNYEEVRFLENKGGASKLPGLFFPRSIVEADLIVSMPKMKTHHWAGYTASMKNLYGTLPGIKYGWPKNVLHFAGIPESVFDINATLGKVIAIVDGIVGMEGDGPIMGSPKPMGLLVIGANVAAVDATMGRLMMIDPRLVRYLQLAAGRVGPINERDIEQRGEGWQDLAEPFQILDAPHLKKFRDRQLELVT